MPGKRIHLQCMFLILGLLMAGCAKAEPMKKITSVVYTSGSGSILPELQWHEQITISRDKAVLTRSGGSQVNAGTWELVLDPAEVRTLFDQLQAVDRAGIRRSEPQDPPDGGGTESFGLVLGDSGEFWMIYDPGVTYSNDTALVQPIRTFLKGLAFPEAAVQRQRME
jgi:hypothetical protein